MKKEKRFEVVLEESLNSSNSIAILRDKQTGVLYLVGAAGVGGGITPLLDKDGKPIINEHEV